MTCKNYIIEYLNKRKTQGFEWITGGTIERYLMEFLPTKGGTIERRCRELREDGKIEKRDDKGFVEYCVI